MPYIGKSPNQGVLNRYIYSATAGQTSFTGSDLNGLSLSYSDQVYCFVYQNGVLLKRATDYTSTSGTSVVLVTGASANDVIEIIAYDTFTVANSYTNAEADTRYPFLGNDSIIRTNGQTISSDITISSSTNALSAGPITVGASATLTVNGFYTIL